MNPDADARNLTPELLLAAYAQGIFPMAGPGDGRIDWYSPDPRAIIPLDGLRVPRSLRRAVGRGGFEVTTDLDFPAVIAGCAGREETWISAEIVRAYTELWKQGHAHSVECRAGGELAGGLYGVALGAAFFGESMFSRRTDASKVALVHLVGILREGGFTLLDAQFLTPHLASLGAVEVSRAAYLRRLSSAVRKNALFPPPGRRPPPSGY